jgi:uncharacterized caspase-like protein
MMREGGVPLGQVFDRVRLRVNDHTHGAQVPWHALHVDAPFVFFERAPDAPPPTVSPPRWRRFAHGGSGGRFGRAIGEGR